MPVIAEDTNTEQDESNHHQYKRRFRPRLSAPPITPASQKPTDNADTWKAPQDWATSPSEDGTTGGAADLGTLDGTVEVSSLTLDITHMQRELDQMINASPQIILQRLKDTWGRYKLDGEPPTAFEENPELDEGLKIMCDEAERALDAALGYKEREMENKRWLLSILNNMEAILESDVTLSPPPVELKSCKVLALFEAQGTFIHPEAQRHIMQAMLTVALLMTGHSHRFIHSFGKPFDPSISFVVGSSFTQALPQHPPCSLPCGLGICPQPRSQLFFHHLMPAHHLDSAFCRDSKAS